MAIIAALIIWYLLGLIGSALVFEFGWLRSRDVPLDVDVKDVVFGASMALLGPFMFVVGTLWTVGWMIGGILEGFDIDWNSTVIKHRRPTKPKGSHYE